MKKKRIAWIDIARGIAIIAVIAGHSLGNYWPNYLGNFLFAFHMPIFFVLSGYLYHEQSQKKLTEKNFFNLLVPYIATILVAFVLLVFYRIIPNSIIAPSKGSSIKAFVISAIYGVGGEVVIPNTDVRINAIGAIWFLLAMFIANQIFNAIMKLKIRLYVKATIFLLITLVGIQTAKVFFLPFSVQPAFIAQIFLLSGYLLKKYDVMARVNYIVLIFLIVLWAWDASFNLFDFEGVNAANIYLAILVGISTSIAIMKISMYIEVVTINLKHKWIEDVLLFWGSQSLILLCFHLIDLDYIQLWPRVIQMAQGYWDYFITVFVGIIYRVLFVSVVAMVMPKIPLLRSFYMHRQHPFKELKRERMKL